MNNPFEDQKTFMTAADQSVGTMNVAQYLLYYNLIKEEVAELMAAHNDDDKVEQLDALVDILVVTIGAIHSMGINPQEAWDEVMRTNLAKIDSATGKVLKREDGKVLKPEGWTPPNLGRFFQ
jgi:predicted HAD superfamily Cof-like phosphohydrolase